MFRITLAALMFLPGLALAHSGTVTGLPFAAGVMHPVSGADHVLAMVGVGLWASILGGRALWAMPLAFVLAMLVGGVVGAFGIAVAGVEYVIVASVILIGLAAAFALRPELWVALLGLAVFGAAHGFAHGVEGPSAGLAVYGMGFAAMTAALHGTGLALGMGLRKVGTVWTPRALGFVTALAGFGLAGGAI